MYSIQKVRSKYLRFLHSLSSEDVAKSPGKDFSRNRKISLFDLILMLLTMAGHTLRTEIDNYFLPLKRDFPSQSAFIQQRNKLSSDAMKTIFYGLRDLFPLKATFQGLHLLACDGSDVNIPSLKGDSSSQIPYNSKKGGYFQIHVNALFDLLEKRYVDIITLPRRKMGENSSLCDMIDRNPMKGKLLYIADRGYACFNTIAHVFHARQYFLFRSKSPESTGSALMGILLPKTDEFDVIRTIVVTRGKVPDHPEDSCIYKHFRKDRRFDFLDPSDKNGVFEMNIRIVKLLLPNNSVEYLLTNLPQKRFPINKLREIYNLRWGIETSFRQLKYALALSYFHSKKREFIEQEVYARVTMYNFVSLVLGGVDVEPSEERTYEYQVSFSDSVEICRGFLLEKMKAKKLKALLSRRLVPIRPDRSFPRNIRSQRLKTLNNRA